MHAVRADALRQVRISADEQKKPTRSANASEPSRHPRAADRAKMPIDDGRPAGQFARIGDGIGGTLWIGQEKQRRDGRGARLTVEPARQPR